MTDSAMMLSQTGEELVEAVIREHARLVFRIANCVLRNATEAEDVVQEVFLRALHYRKRLAGVADRKAWLARIAWRVAVEHRRRGTSKAALDGSDETASLASGEIGAEQALLNKERSEFLQRLIAGLPEQLRDPLVLSAFEELSPREIAEMLDISEAAVRSRAFRAREILRSRMAAWTGAGI